MNMLAAIILISGMIVTSPSLGQSSPLPYLHNVHLAADVKYDDSSSHFLYFYKIENGASSIGSITTIEIDLSRDSAAAFLDTTGLQFKYLNIKNNMQRMYARMAEKVVAVGVPELPRYGDAALTVRATLALYGGLIGPGETRKGFTVMSKALPGIRSFTVEPKYDPSDYYPALDEVETDEEMMRIDSLVRRDYERLPVHGKTIGPVAPPARFEAAAFLDTLDAYVNQAAELGWIQERGLGRSLKAKLDNARRQLERGNVQPAANVLGAFMKEVEAQRGKKLSGEAYALLKYNTEYVIEHLK